MKRLEYHQAAGWGVTLLCLLAAPTSASPAQPKPVPEPPPNVRILTLGGFLGQLDGMPELPTSVHDHSDCPHAAGSSTCVYGGLQGASDWLQRQTGAPFLLLTGDNFSLTFNLGASRDPADTLFLHSMQHLRQGIYPPDAVALGREDLFRALHSGKAAEDFALWLAGGSNQVPWLASNAFIRVAREGLNKVEEGDLKLLVPGDKSVDLKRSLNIQFSTRPSDAVEFCLYDATGVPWEVDPATGSWKRDAQAIAWTASGRSPMQRVLVGSPGKPCDSAWPATSGANPSDVPAWSDAEGHKISAPSGSGTVSPKEGPRPWKVNLRLPAPLRPGHTYVMMVRSTSGKGLARFEFQTIHALTPASTPASPLPGLPPVTRAAYEGLPIIEPNREGVSLLVLAAVDPAVTSELPTEAWKWTEVAASSIPYCTRATCTIELLPPTETISALLAIAAQQRDLYANTKAFEPIQVRVLLSSLTDKQTVDVASTIPEFRVIALAPESKLLGRAARADGKDHSGDLGYYALLNGDAEDSFYTQAWVRPEWLAETVADVSASATADGRFDATVRRWDIPGQELAFVANSAASTATYYLGNPALGKILSTPVPAYPAGPYSGLNWEPKELWTDADAFQMFLLDAARRGMQADLALLPTDTLDDSWMAWLKDKFSSSANSSGNWLSDFVLRRVLFRSEPLRRLEIPGNKLEETLKEIVKQGSDQGVKLCLAGIGVNGCPVDLDSTELAVNARPPVSDHYYTVALPYSLAQKYKDKFTITGHKELYEIVDECLRPSGGGSTPACGLSVAGGGAAGPRSPAVTRAHMERLSHQPLWFTNLSAAEVQFSLDRVGVPADESTDSFGRIPLAGREAKNAKKFSYKGEFQAGWDYRRWLLFSAVASVDEAGTAAGGPISITKDELSFGLQADYRFIRPKHMSVFAGVYDERRLRTRKNAFSPARKIDNLADPLNPGLTVNATVKGESVTQNVLRPDYYFSSVGLRWAKWKAATHIQLNRLTVRLDYGRSRNNPIGAELSDPALPDAASTATMDSYLSDGPQKILDKAFAANPTAFQQTSQLNFDYVSINRARIQLDCDWEFPLWKQVQGTAKATVSFKSRWYVNGDDVQDPQTGSALVPTQTYDLSTGLDIPIFRRLTLGPALQYYAVRANLGAGFFTIRTFGIVLKLPSYISIGHGKQID